MCHARLRLHPLACLLFAAALAGAQSDVNALVEQGRTLKNQKKYDQAAAVLQQAIDQDEDNIQAHHLLGWVLLAQKDKEGAADEFATVVDLDPDSAAGKQDQEALARIEADAAGGAKPGAGKSAQPTRGGFLKPLLFAAAALLVVVAAFAFVKRDQSRSAGSNRAVDLGGFEIPAAAAVASSAVAQPLDLTQFEAPAPPVTDLSAFETPAEPAVEPGSFEAPAEAPPTEPEVDLGSFEAPAEPPAPAAEAEAEVDLGSFEAPAEPVEEPAEADVDLGSFEALANQMEAELGTAPPAEPEPDAPAADAEVELGSFETPAEAPEEDPLASSGLLGDDDADERAPIELLDDGDDEPLDFSSLDSGGDEPASSDKSG